MARLTDILILLDQQSVIQQVLFSEGFSDDKLRIKILRWQGVEITKIPDTEWDFNQGTVRWNGLRFELIRFSLNSFTQCLLLRREPLRERLMEAALDFMDDGIQLYGPDAFALAESGALRRDLFYRLASTVVEIPPLRERTEDLEELVWHFVRERSPRSAQPIEMIAPDFWPRLRQYSWPGNVRELFHILECSVSVAKRGVLRQCDLPVYFLRHSTPLTQTTPPAVVSSPKEAFQKGLDVLVREYERQVLSQAYLACGKNATQTAELLKISRQSFQYYKKKYDL